MRYALVILENARKILEQYNCSPSMLREEEPGTAIYYYFMLHIYGVYFKSLWEQLDTAYRASGLEMPTGLLLGLKRIAVYFQYISQDYYNAMVGNKPFSCNTIPSNDTIAILKQLLDNMQEEIYTVLNDGEGFKGLSNDTVQVILEIGTELDSIG
ncbi:MAG: hypothetical protein F7B18_05675 [Desulfurococcales archaeon]|nr:hypothetical protein [Desulfurococcales archaeon]